MVATKQHAHRLFTSTIRCYRGPAWGAAKENRMAHGGVTEVQKCRCGQYREVNRNGGHVERGAWQHDIPNHR